MGLAEREGSLPRSNESFRGVSFEVLGIAERQVGVGGVV